MAKLRPLDIIKKKEREDVCGSIRSHIIEGNSKGKPMQYKPDSSYRKALAELEFKNHDTYTIGDSELTEDHIWSLELRLALHKTYVPRRLRQHISFDIASDEKAPTPEDDTRAETMTSKTRLECPIFLTLNVNSSVVSYQYERKDIF
ncbi:hypothetical protein N7445_009628 [Penicillium cf. griseofulvum]|nr:hypothetical protein N7445_009628 [Penicillium cf. griseofulvum]